MIPESPEQSWKLVEEWTRRVEPDTALSFRPLTAIALTPLIVLGYSHTYRFIDMAWLAGIGVFGAYFATTVMLYRVMRKGSIPPAPVEVDPSEVSGLMDRARLFGLGLGIDENSWRAYRQVGSTAISSLPSSMGGSWVSLSCEGSEEDEERLTIEFVGVQENGRVLVSGSQIMVFPLAAFDVHYDIDANPRELFEAHRARTRDLAGALPFEKYLELLPTENLIKQAGFLRFARTWGWAVWTKRGLRRSVHG